MKILKVGKRNNPTLKWRALHKWRIFMEFTLTLFYTSSRAAKRRGCDILSVAFMPRRGRPGVSGLLRRRWLLAMTGYAKVSLKR